MGGGALPNSQLSVVDAQELKNNNVKVMGGSTAEIPAREVIHSDISDSDLNNWTITLLSVWKGKQLKQWGCQVAPHGFCSSFIVDPLSPPSLFQSFSTWI